LKEIRFSNIDKTWNKYIALNIRAFNKDIIKPTVKISPICIGTKPEVMALRSPWRL